MKKAIILPLFTLLLVGCDKPTKPNSSFTSSSSSSSSQTVVSSISTSNSTLVSTESVTSSGESSLKATQIIPSESNINIRVNESKKIEVSFDVATFEEDYSLTSSSTEYVTINGKNIVGVKPTSTPVTITITSVSGLTATVSVNIFNIPTSLSLTTDLTSSNYISPILPTNKLKEITIDVDNNSLANLEYEIIKNEAEASIEISKTKINTFTITANKEGVLDFKIYDTSSKEELYDQAYIYFYDDTDASFNKALESLSSSNFKSDNDLFSHVSFSVTENNSGTVSYDYESTDGIASYEASYVISNKQFSEIQDNGNDGNYEITTDNITLNINDNDTISFLIENSDFEEANFNIVRG